MFMMVRICGDRTSNIEKAKDGNFRGVRTFLLQMKHAAAVLHLVAAGILGEPPEARCCDGHDGERV